jgi:hypothetical protein
MPEVDRQQRVFRVRYLRNYFAQQLFSFSAAALTVIIPLVLLVAFEGVVRVLAVALALVATVVLMGGVMGLVEGTADHSVRRRVQRGAWACAVLAVLGGLGACALMWRLGTPAWAYLAWLSTSLAALATYPLFARQYWKYVRSVT